MTFAWGPSPNGNYLPMANIAIDSAKNPVKEEGMYVEPVVGFRCWLVDGHNDELRLRSWTQDVIWPIREALEAGCLRKMPTMKREHVAPDTHGCGIYAVNTLEQARQWGRQNEKGVVGTVKLWGRVIVCEQGYLAQYAYPEGLLLRAKRVTRKDVVLLADRYDVQIDTSDGWE